MNAPVAVDLDVVRRELTAAVLSDVLDQQGLRHQALGAGLTLLDQDTTIAGYAFGVHIQRVYDVPAEPFAGLVAALDAIGPDEVFITPTQRATDIAVWGELLSTVCQRRGAAGAITDGLVRDVRAVRELGFPVISGGTIPYDSLGRHEILAHRVPCLIDGVRIEPGDLVVADSDGTVVVPRAIAAWTVQSALQKRRGEHAFRDAVRQGMSATEAFARFGVL
ncbi:RraA family protein [Ruania alkalisoli]|uniref:Putative 4-hydroxy-4-methyl-2-oxoglutarate aldolase n=1 Tax=Ruania alkalisoli TaxID=2779775 RepID=A0A7M1STK3_9MICO|nr:RraA family protein [Ruania alkalisoli]QOR70835.1 RraA family protein [Ruania alkalisoli]